MAAVNETALRVFDSGTMGVVFVDQNQRIVGCFGPLVADWIEEGGLVTDALPFLAGYEDVLGEIAGGQRERFDLYKLSLVCPPGERRRVFSVHVHPRGNRQLGVVLHDMTSMTELEQRVVQQRNELALAERDLKRAKEEAEAANQAKTLFLSHIGHELFTPLQVIIGDAELLKDTDVTRFPEDNVRAYVSDILQHATFLNDLISDLLDLARIEAGSMALSEERVDLGAVIAEAVDMVSGLSYAAGVDIAVDPDAPPPPDVHGDPRRLKQILINLVGNAAKFTPPFGRVRVQTTLDEGRGLVIAVSDTGSGIDATDLARVTEPFVQVNPEEGAKPLDAMAGAGLGLPLARTLARLHGGDLELKSMPGAGTTATIVLPASRILFDAQ